MYLNVIYSHQIDQSIDLLHIKGQPTVDGLDASAVVVR